MVATFHYDRGTPEARQAQLCHDSAYIQCHAPTSNIMVATCHIHLDSLYTQYHNLTCNIMVVTFHIGKDTPEAGQA